MRSKLAVVAVFFCIWSYSNLMHAHHSFPGVYDIREQLILEGVTTQFLFRNPHTFIFLEVEISDGNVEEWHLELPPSWALERRGISQESIRAGDALLVTCNPARDGSRACGLGQRGGFYRQSDAYIYGLDPRTPE